ncbi:DNA translocase FtsK [Ligilactobacillus pabuli]|uniref:DNA translocase FtsK n=2 Tax=Ligilactobacillus pabuli TaxID=2886039 RepID=A0ABQ5JKI1_9LACO|nr:DNA translocase FtsK [Ligilactobacillus pabuli]
MAKRKKQTRRKQTKKQQQQMTTRISGLILLVLSLTGCFHLGNLGMLLANCFRLFLGDAYQIGTLLVAGLGLYLLTTAKELRLKTRYLVGSSLVLAGLILFLSTYLFGRLDLHTDFVTVTWQYLKADIVANSVGNAVGGGLLGAGLYQLTYFLLAQIGSYVCAVLLVLLGGCALFKISFGQVVDLLGMILYQVVHFLKKIWLWLVDLGSASLPWLKKQRAKIQTKLKQDYFTEGQAPESQDTLPQEPEAQVKSSVPNQEQTTIENDINTEKHLPRAHGDATDPALWNERQETAETPKRDAKPHQVPLTNPDYELPAPSLLQDVAPTDQSAEKKALRRNQDVLKQTLESFGVDVELKNTILGPSVTKYELHPAIGVKVSKIVNLSDDLALALAAKDIRIEAPIPGKSLIGIEVPNQQVATISFKDVISAMKPDPNKPLEVPLGRDVSGNLITADLSKMPHLLIAGSTGSGKSVAINGIITSLLMNDTPDQVKMMLVDPKKVELGVYNDIPHLLTPVVTDPKKAARALHKLVAEMERRYELFANTGQRNINGYNQMVKRQNQAQKTAEPTLPYIVAIVDELSDLMMVASNEVEDAIIRLAQMARAAGIHMILATQRPSVDVITGLIKANVPSRMAFAVSSGTDSRTIIDSSGAEKLLGRGDMLFLPMGMNKPVRVQGAFISDQDVENVVDFVKSQQEAAYDSSMEVSDEEAAGDGSDDEEDELFSDAVDFITREQKCSISLLQRKFKIGYNRAARIVDRMAEKGLVGPQEGSKPRQVYLKKEAE